MNHSNVYSSLVTIHNMIFIYTQLSACMVGRIYGNILLCEGYMQGIHFLWDISCSWGLFLSTQPVLHCFVIRAYLYDLHLILRFTCLSTTFRGMNIYIMKSSMKQVYRKLTQYPSKDLWGNIMCECLYLVILSAYLVMMKHVRHLTNQRYWILPSYEFMNGPIYSSEASVTVTLS